MGECKSLNITLVYSYAADDNPKMAVLRIILYKREVYRLPRKNQQIRILSGIAWVTRDREDIILTQGEKLDVSSSDRVVISPLGYSPLVLEQYHT